MKTKLIAFSIYQIMGGLIGIGITIHLITSVSYLPILLLSLLLIAVGLYALSICSGIMLLSNPEKGLKISRINQLFQIIQIGGFGYMYKYFSGSSLLVGVDLTNSINFKVSFNLLSSFQLNLNSGDSSLFIHVNLVAVFFIIWINKLLKEIQDQNASQELDLLISEHTEPLPLT
jgi:hypothetical protein